MSDAPHPRVLVIHGPNLNLLGEREPAVYGSATLAELDASLHALAGELGVALSIVQSSSEGAIIDAIHAARPTGAQPQDGIVINPGGYTHTSVAIHDALRAVPVPAIEVHLSNIYRRETFRHASVTGVACAGVIMGLGTASYLLALRHLADTLRGPADTLRGPADTLRGAQPTPSPNSTASPPAPRDPARPSP